MEKCTFCIQRVEKAKITARKQDRPLADGDVVTACQSACPTQAIEFGNVADPKSVVSQRHDDDRSYGMLEQLNIKPRTRYLARIRNPHKRLMTARQLDDLQTVKPPHHGDHGHDDHGGHGNDQGDHADEDHADNDHAHGGGHDPSEHKNEETHASENKKD
jgi:molybdopterin-containing oxidoreductase family iron-sulfur binding subunit